MQRKTSPSMLAVTAGLAVFTLSAAASAQAPDGPAGAQPDPQEQQQDRPRLEADSPQRQQPQRPERSNDAEPDPDQAAQNRQGQEQPDQPAQPRVRLGVRLQPSPTTGAFVSGVMLGGPADRAGIRAGDYILSINGQKVDSPEQLSELAQNVPAGEQARVTVWRNREQQTLNVDFTEQRQAGFRGQATLDVNGRPVDQSQAWLGVFLEEAGQTDQRGVLVGRTYPSGPAARAGIQSGDVIVRVGDEHVASPGEVVTAIEQRQPDEDIELLVLRDGQEQTITARLGSRTAFLGEFEQEPETGFEDDADQLFGEIPEHAMMLEQHRHFARQHERIEAALEELTEQVRQLRREVQQLRGGTGRAEQVAPGTTTDAPEGLNR